MTQTEPQIASTGRWVPRDVPIVIVSLAVANAVIALSPWQSIRVPFGLVLLLVLPGYTLLTVLFPRWSDADRSGRNGITGTERAALSFGTSVALLPPLYLIAFALDRPNPSILVVFGVLNGWILVTMLIGYLRRMRVDPPHRFDLPGRHQLVRDGIDRPSDNGRRALLANVALGAAAVSAIGSLIYTISSPPDGERFSEFYLVTQNENGEYTAGDYPTRLTAGEPQSWITGVENHEGESLTYIVVAELQRVTTAGSTIEVLERGDRIEETIRIAPGESTYVEQVITPDIIGENLRIQYGLYRGTSNGGAPYRELQLWVDVFE